MQIGVRHLFHAPSPTPEKRISIVAVCQWHNAMWEGKEEKNGKSRINAFSTQHDTKYSIVWIFERRRRQPLVVVVVDARRAKHKRQTNSHHSGER